MLINKYYQRISTKKKKDKNPLIIFCATDSHVYAEVDGDAEHEDAILGTRYFYTSGQKLQNFVDDVNQSRPDLTVFLGDIVENWSLTGSPELFMSKWDQIVSKKELTIGNHDMAGGGGAIANTDMADLLGYGSASIVAGSKYNQSFYLDNGYNKIKVIMMDTNINADGNHVASTPQLLKQPVRDWVESEITNSTENNIIIFSHGNPYDNSAHFNADDAAAFKNMLDGLITSNPDLNIYCISGHNHGTTVKQIANLTNIKAFIIPTVVDYIPGKYAIVYFSEQDGISFEVKDLRYPYP